MKQHQLTDEIGAVGSTSVGSRSSKASLVTVSSVALRWRCPMGRGTRACL